jgi:23S rRNA (cytidine1920-2'-O)/16S rRNA (cytidine1409-2'-O)-methyltransferase
VLVDGFPVRNPRSLVRAGARIGLREDVRLRGEAKLEAAFEAFPVEVAGRVALDVGAAAGGFTRVLLRAGARRVHAVDAGYGQLLGSLRQDARVAVLERTNLAQLEATRVADVLDVVTIDVSYVSLATAVPQLGRLVFAPDADLVALVKPMFELGLAEPPTDDAELRAALDAAVEGIAWAGWHVRSSIRSPVAGARGAVELLLHARRAG